MVMVLPPRWWEERVNGSLTLAASALTVTVQCHEPLADHHVQMTVQPSFWMTTSMDLNAGAAIGANPLLGLLAVFPLTSCLYPSALFFLVFLLRQI